MNVTSAAPALRTPDFSELAPAFAARFARIIAGLLAVIARGFLRNPALVVLTVPLHRRLTRNAQRLTALMARLAAGEATGSGAGPTANRPRAQAPRERSPIPTTKGWIIRELKHEAAAYRSLLAHLLAEPGVSDLLAAAPALGRILNPLCRMLSLPAPVRPAVPPKPKRREAAPPPPSPPRDTNPARPIAAPRRPLCPRLAQRWPWRPHPSAKTA